jgi:parvulin-like peptidyl-prolyl isomerase
MLKPWNYWGLFTIVILLSFSAAVLAEEVKVTGTGEGVLVEMEDGVITVEEFQQQINRLPAESPLKMGGTKSKERFLEEIIRTRLFVREARRLKMHEKSEVAAEIQDAIDAILAHYYLKEHGLDKIRITDEEIKTYMENNPERFQRPETVKVRQIQVRVSKGAGPDALKAARKKAEEILAKAKAGEDFVKLAEAYSEDRRTRRRGGDLDYIKKGKMGKEFDDMVFHLKPGEVSPVIRTHWGLNIFKVEDQEPARELTLTDVRHMVTSRLKAEKEHAATEALTRELMERYKVKIHKELLK